MKIILRLHLQTFRNIHNNLDTYAKKQEETKRGKIRLLCNKIDEVIQVMEEMLKENRYGKHEL